MIAEFRAARTAVGDRITLRLGAELGDAVWGIRRMESMLAEAPPLDFLIGSIHTLSEKMEGRDLYFLTPRDEQEARDCLADYLGQVRKLAEWGRFQVLGHLTLPLRYLNENRGMHVSFDGFEEEIAEIFRLIIPKGIGIELNTNRGNTPLPDESFVSPVPASSVQTPPEPEPLPDKWVCLTFDDGPSKTTPDVLAALNRAGVKATFFVVATGHNDKYLPLVSEAAAAGHQIALHSASHEYSDIYQSPDAYWKDIGLLKERLSPYLSADGLRYLRFPGGSTNTVSRRYGGRGLMQQLKEEVTAKGYAYVDWNVCAEDAVGGKPSAGTIFRNIVRETGEQTQCIVLMHDSATTHTTAEALPDIIQWYKDNGFAFLTVEQAVPLPTT